MAVTDGRRRAEAARSGGSGASSLPAPNRAELTAGSAAAARGSRTARPLTAAPAPLPPHFRTGRGHAVPRRAASIRGLRDATPLTPSQPPRGAGRGARRPLGRGWRERRPGCVERCSEGTRCSAPGCGSPRGRGMKQAPCDRPRLGASRDFFFLSVRLFPVEVHLKMTLGELPADPTSCGCCTSATPQSHTRTPLRADTALAFLSLSAQLLTRLL